MSYPRDCPRTDSFGMYRGVIANILSLTYRVNEHRNLTDATWSLYALLLCTYGCHFNIFLMPLHLHSADVHLHSVVELNIAIIVCSVPGFSKFLKTLNWQWNLLGSLRSKISSSQDFAHSPGSSGQQKSKSQATPSDKLPIQVVMYPNTISEHTSPSSTANPAQHDRDTLDHGKVDLPPQQVEDTTLAYEHIYNSWGLDPYLDCSGTRDSILYTAAVEDQARLKVSSRK